MKEKNRRLLKDNKKLMHIEGGRRNIVLNSEYNKNK